MVSKQGQKFLRWMYAHSELKYFAEIKRECEFDVDYDLLETLCKNGYLTSWEPPDALPPETSYDIPELMFRISDTGKAYIENVDLEQAAREQKQIYDAEIIKHIQDIAESAQLQSDVAKEDAERAKRDARTASLTAWFAIILSIVTIIVNVLSYADKICVTLQGMLAFLTGS